MKNPGKFFYEWCGCPATITNFIHALFSYFCIRPANGGLLILLSIFKK